MAKIKLPFFREKEDRQIQQTATIDRPVAPVTAEMPPPDLQAAAAAKGPDTAQETAKQGVEMQGSDIKAVTNEIPHNLDIQAIAKEGADRAPRLVGETSHRLDVQALANRAADRMNRAEEFSTSVGERMTEPTTVQAVTHDGTFVREAATPGDKTKKSFSGLKQAESKMFAKEAYKAEFSIRKQIEIDKRARETEAQQRRDVIAQERALKEALKPIKPLIRDVGRMILAVNVLGKTGIAASTLENIDRNDIPVASRGFRTPRPDPGLEQGTLFPGQGRGPF